MRSIALFPCPYTDGARIVGELSNALQLPVYSDAMLFDDVAAQFGVAADRVREVITRKTPTLNRYILQKDKYLNLLRCSLEAQRLLSPGGRLFYGLHTSLFEHHVERVLRVLVCDDEKNRVKRAMWQEGFREDVAGGYIRFQDEKVSGWTQYLFNKEPYDPSLYDLVIHYGSEGFFEVTTYIMQHYVNSNGFCGLAQNHLSPLVRGEGCLRQL